MPHTYLPDPRPYPERTVNNKLLLLATRIARPESAEDAEQARAELKKQIAQMLGLRHYIGLSVAMTMAGAPDIYTALMDTVDEALQPENDEQLQWFALPVIVVAGADKAGELKSSCPEALINACLANYPALRPLTRAVWLPQLIRSDDFAKIKPDDWYAAKESADAAAEFAASLPTASAAIPQDQSVHALYALGYGGREIQAALGQSLREAALPLMQVWQEYLAEENMTLFTNPLSPASPLSALADASRTRLRMALDVFRAPAKPARRRGDGGAGRRQAPIRLQCRRVRLFADEPGIFLAAVAARRHPYHPAGLSRSDGGLPSGKHPPAARHPAGKRRPARLCRCARSARPQSAVWQRQRRKQRRQLNPSIRSNTGSLKARKPFSGCLKTRKAAQ